jgi:carboxyl-terminal processing protease
VVTAVRRGSDAERAGIQVSDQVLKVGQFPAEEAVAQRLTPAVDRTDPKARGWALLSVLTGRAEEARHFTLKVRDGSVREVSLPVLRGFDRSAGELTSATLPGNIGLIRFNNSLGDQKTVAAFDSALQRLRGTRALILDLRDVPSGGDSSVALGIMGRFVKTMLPYQRHRIPHYGQPDVERNWVEMTAPRGPFPYDAPLAVLVDHWTGSMGEGMAIGFDAMHRAVVVGTEMAHLAGAVTDFRLTRTGVDVAFATEQLFHVNGTPRQDWLPPVLVSAPVTRDRDPILARALQELSPGQGRAH